MKIAVLAAVAFAALLLFLAACNTQPKPDQTLAGLPSAERVALEAICKAAGTEPSKLRDVGFVADFRDERNRQAICIRNGHVHTLGLAKTTFTEPPDFSALTGLEALWLEDGALQSWPNLSKLTQLKALHLNGQPLGTPPPNMLPRQLENLDLARTNVADLAFLTGFFSLRKLDVSGTKVASIDPVMGLELNEVNLSNTPIRSLPPRLPANGSWELNLDQTALTQIPNFAKHPPGYKYSPGTPTKGDTYTGIAKVGNVNVDGNIAQLIDARPIHLPGNELVEADSGLVTIEATVASGNVRVWLREPSGVFAQPWFPAGKVKGWSRLRPMGAVSMDVQPGKTTTLRGELWGVGTHSQNPYYFIAQPVDGGTAANLKFKVRTAK